MGRFDNYKFHPSSLGKIMTNDRSGKAIGETCKKYLLECWVTETYGRTKDFTNKYMEKGILQEEESITLYSLVTKTFYKKNKETIQNDFFIGTPDLYEGTDILHAEKIKDIKTSWDIFTFYNVFHNPINPEYKWQLQGYNDLTGAKEAGLVYCLVDTPDHMIEDAKRKLSWQMGLIDPDTNQDYIKQAQQIEKNMKFGDIPNEKKYIEFKLDRDNVQIEQAHQRVIECRNFLNSLDLK